MSADIRLETESETGSVEDIPSHMSATTYHPKHALKLAIRDWLPEFNRHKSAFGRAGSVITKELPMATVVASLSQLPPSATLDTLAKDDSSNGNGQMSVSSTPAESSLDFLPGSQFTPLTKELVNSLVEPPVILNPLLEPMDCAPSPSSSQKDDALSLKSTETNSEEMQTEAIEDEDSKLTVEDVSLLIDLFYLPFEHGAQGMQLLNEFQWLKSNGYLVADYRRRKPPVDGKQTPEVFEWCERARKFDDMNSTVSRLLERLTIIRNRSLLYELYPYMWDVKGVISLLNSYVKWLGE